MATKTSETAAFFLGASMAISPVASAAQGNEINTQGSNNTGHEIRIPLVPGGSYIIQTADGRLITWDGQKDGFFYYDSSPAADSVVSISGDEGGVSASSIREVIPPFVYPDRGDDPSKVLNPFALEINRAHTPDAKRDMLEVLEAEGIPTDDLVTSNWTTTAYIGDTVDSGVLAELGSHGPMVWSVDADVKTTFRDEDWAPDYRTWEFTSFADGRQDWLDNGVRRVLKSRFGTEDLSQVTGLVLIANEPFFQQSLIPGYERTYTLAATYLTYQRELPNANIALPPLMQDNMYGEVVRELYRRHHGGKGPVDSRGRLISDLEEITLRVAEWYIGEILEAIDQLAKNDKIFVQVYDKKDEDGNLLGTYVYDLNVEDIFDPALENNDSFRVEEIDNPFKLEGFDDDAVERMVEPGDVTLHMYDLYNRWGDAFPTHVVERLDQLFVERFGRPIPLHILHEAGAIDARTLNDEDTAELWFNKYLHQFEAVFDLWVISGCNDMIRPTIIAPFAPAYAEFVLGDDGKPLFDEETGKYKIVIIDYHVEANYAKFALFEPDEETGHYVLTANGKRVINAYKQALLNTINKLPNSADFSISIEDPHFVQEGLDFLSEHNRRATPNCIYLPRLERDGDTDSFTINPGLQSMIDSTLRHSHAVTSILDKSSANTGRSRERMINNPNYTSKGPKNRPITSIS